MKNKILALSSLILALAVFSCAKKPVGMKTQEPAEVYQAAASFYDFLVSRDLDSFADKDEMLSRFQDQIHFEAFLDSIIPAMWARNFERNRIIAYQILAIDLNDDQTEAWVKIWIRSDDTLPFEKVMTYSQRWYNYKSIWYPSEIKAGKPNIIEKYR
jgi:hypothetical protein